MSGRNRDAVPAPPRLAAGLVRAVLPPRSAGSQLADLDERYVARARRRGTRPARRWYWRQCIGFLIRVPVARLLDVTRSARGGGDVSSKDRGEGAMHGLRPAGPPGDPRGERRSLSTAVTRPEKCWPSTLRRAVLGLGRDLSSAARTLRAHPTFSAPAIIVLALAIGANTAVLSIVDNVLWRELPVPGADSVVMLWDMLPPGERSDPRVPITYDHFNAWSRRADLFSRLAAMETINPTVETDDFPVRPNGMLVSGETFLLLGAEAALGRVLLPADDRPGAHDVVVLSDRLWRSSFGADPDIVGRALMIDGTAVTVVGVMPADFWFFDPYMFARSLGDRDRAQPDLWRPLNSRDWVGTDFADYPALRIMARLRDDVPLETAAAAARSMRAALATEDGREELSIALVPLADAVLGGMGRRLWLLQGAVTLLVIIACVNVMSLVLAKASATRAELGVRAALGAGRAALIRLTLCEATLLALAGGTLGLMSARALGGALLSVAPRELPLAERVAVDARIALMTLAVALAAGILAGSIPALSIDLRSIARSMGSGSRSVTTSRSANRARFGLVVAEVALTVVLLIGAAVMLRSFIGVWRTDPGFERSDVLTLFSPLARTPGEEPDFAFHYRLLEGIRGLPGVTAVGGTTHLPFSNWRNSFPVVVDDTVSMDEAPEADGRWVTEGYIGAMGIDLRAGRDFRAADDAESEPVVLINEAFAERFFDLPPEAVATLVGRHIGVVAFGPRRLVQRRIVGVVENVKTFRLFETDRPLVYVPTRQHATSWSMRYVVRTETEPLAVVPAIRRLAADIDARQALTEILPLDTLVAQSITEERFWAQILTAFGALAFVIAATGVYGTVAYNVRLRLREVGVRIAFGAQPRSIQRLIVAQGLSPVVLGVLAGCAGAAALVRGIEGLLHDVSPLDPMSFAGGATLFVMVATTAALIPARRAAAADPIEVLRSD